MDIIEWAKQEIEIAKKRERGNTPEEKWNYGCACYDSAYKAFKSLCEDGHSGMSINITKSILCRLIDGRPLTPIEDIYDEWNLCDFGKRNECKQYQSKRMSSLFKKVYTDGSIKYNDINRIYKRDINTGNTWHSCLVDCIIDEMDPITMPYMPKTVHIEVATEDFLFNKRNGDYDTIGIYYAIDGDSKIGIYRYFADSTDFPFKKETYPGWVEISKDEFNWRKEHNSQ